MDKCEHRWISAFREIQGGIEVNGWRCENCDEWLEEEHDCKGEDGCEHPSHEDNL